MAQSVKHPTQLISAQVVIPRSVSLSPALGSVLTAQSLEPALDPLSPPLSAPPCLSKIRINLKKMIQKVSILLKALVYPIHLSEEADMLNFVSVILFALNM